jgi:predicted O-methyltransferase YrrM
VIERLGRDGTVVARSDGTLHHVFPVAVGVAEGEALREWVSRKGATRIIEIGLGYGISALFVCEGLVRNGDAAARHVVVDPYQATRFGNCGLQILEEAGVASLVEHHAQESQMALPRFLGEGRRFDLAFVDGNHRFDGIFLDLVYLGRLLHPGAIVLVGRLSAAGDRARGVVLPDESRLDARTGVTCRCASPVGGPSHLGGSGHAMACGLPMGCRWTQQPIGRCGDALGQAVWPTRTLRLARLAASTASPVDSARAAASTPSPRTSQSGCPLGSACAGVGVLP